MEEKNLKTPLFASTFFGNSFVLEAIYNKKDCLLVGINPSRTEISVDRRY